MKKKLALLLSAVMVASMVPMTAFAKTSNYVDRTVTAKADAKYYDGTTLPGDSTATGVAPNLIIQKDDLDKVDGTSAFTYEFELSLTNAEWLTGIKAKLEADIDGKIGNDVITATVTPMTDRIISVKIETEATTTATANSFISIPLYTTLKGEGDASVTIDSSTIISSGTYKFANVAAGATTTTIEKKTDLKEGTTEIKELIIKETAANSLENGKKIKLKLTNGFEFADASAITANVIPSSVGSVGSFSLVSASNDNEVEATFTRTGSDSAATIVISGIEVKFDFDDVDAEDIAEITVSGAGVTKQTVEVGTARDFGVSITAENKTLPTFIAGRADDTETLKVTFKETIENSWLDNRKTEITFPEGVKVTDVDVTGEKNFSTATITPDHKTNTSVVTLTDLRTGAGKVEAKFQFQLSIDPGFTGDIVATFGGAGLEEDVDVIIGTAVAPITVEAVTNEVSIDYRNVAIGDIIITETEAGNLKSGSKLYLEIEEMKFDGTPTVEVVEGDIKIDKVKVLSGSEGTLEITIKTASGKTPAVLKVTGNELYLGRSLPAGSYALSLVYGGSSDAIFQNYIADVKAAVPADKVKFETDEVLVLKDFIEVVTAGRDQDDSTFTTQISVTIGADKLVAGKTDIALDVPAYISEGYTMLPVRAVTEALSGKAIVRWDDATKTVTITFGQRVISMTVGSKTMNINGVAVQMSKACEITGERAFIPLRDLGYALGLNDSKINWDDTTKTATLN